ncbi:MAG: hypothetical protein DDT32_01576 [Syntrophomonadaceae bacterium]|nr:hypothetical protein [Bacillota bacterium]MBT9147810.1 hypothetical protein [Bacillota bacterium]
MPWWKVASGLTAVGCGMGSWGCSMWWSSAQVAGVAGMAGIGAAF